MHRIRDTEDSPTRQEVNAGGNSAFGTLDSEYAKVPSERQNGSKRRRLVRKWLLAGTRVKQSQQFAHLSMRLSSVAIFVDPA